MRANSPPRCHIVMMIMLLGQPLLASLPVWVSRPKKRGSTRHVDRRISGKGFHVASCAAKRLFLLSIRGLYQGMEARLSFLVLPAPVSWAERRTILLSFIKMDEAMVKVIAGVLAAAHRPSNVYR